MTDNWQKELEKPGKIYRSAPFWAWNEKINEEETRFQIREMDEKGMGGFFIHSREGLETEYLSEEWMRQVEIAVREAAKRDMEVWIYDDDKWPSGCAGGMVSRLDPQKYSARGLTMELSALAELEDGGIPEIGREYADGKILGIYTIQTEDDKIVYLHNGIEERKDSRILILRREISRNSEWYNGYAPTDNLNPEAVRAFLNLTHEAYKKNFKADFGRTIKGFFTDEPNCCDFYSIFTEGRPWITWTDELPEYFQEKRGYELHDQLPYLFFDGEGCEKIRHDFWRTIAERFQESYMKQIYEWCEKEGMELTGHILYENDLGYQTRVCGAAMPQYKYLHRPGIDLLGEQTKEYLTAKQCTSVAHQYGKKHTITETYGCTGWEFGSDGQKWLGDWQYVLGIDRRCQHLAQYSISGCRKRDYPPVFSYQNTNWEYNGKLEDYFARLSLCGNTGEVVRKVLVIHPMSSIWTKCRSSEKEDFNHIEMNMGWLDKHITDLNQWGEEYNRLAKMLMSSHVDFDFGDEMLIEEDGKVEKGQFHVGQAVYDVVIVPRVLSLFENTIELLREFDSQGGKILWTGEFPKMVEGSTEKGKKIAWEKFENIIRIPNYNVLPETVKNVLDWDICVKNREETEDVDILLMTRKTENGYIQIAVNNDRTTEHIVIAEFPGIGRVMCYCPWTDEMQELQTEISENGKMRFLLEFAPAETKLLFIDKNKLPQIGKVEFPYEHPHYAAPVFAALGPKAEISRNMENVLTLDQCSWSLEGSGYGDETDVWKAQKAIREQLDMRQIYYNGVPQRYFWLDEKCEKDGTPFGMRFRFMVKDAVPRTCYAVIEKSESFKVFLDGKPAEWTGESFIDHSMNKWKLPPLNTGLHELMIEGEYSHEMELEDIFIIGDFCVDNERSITEEKGSLHFGDWTSQGYYHYPGAITYKFMIPPKEKEEHRYFLNIGEFEGALAELTINGKKAALLLRDSMRRVDITEYLTEDENSLELCVVGSPRNMFGPFHQTYTGCSRISWADFRTEGRFYTEDYVLEPYGLREQIFITIE